MKKLILVALLAVSTLWAKPMLTPEVKAMLKEAKQEVSGITAQELVPLLSDRKVIMIDVRDPNEWAKGTIKADKLIKISRGFLEVKYPKLILKKYSKKDRFVVYCGIEPRSILATQTLKKLGFENVSYLKGGFKNWKKSGLPIAREK